MGRVERVSFPQGKIYIKQNKGGKDIINSAYIEFNKSYENKLNHGFDQTQVFLDNKVIMHLQEYVTWLTGTQAKSIRLASVAGSGEVWIAVPYAHYQAYGPVRSTDPKNRKRGRMPFERMKADKRDSIYNEVVAYSRRING